MTVARIERKRGNDPGLELKERRMHMSEGTVTKAVDDLGIAAYVGMHGFKLIGRKGKVFYFEIYREEENDFNQTLFDYVNSDCQKFDRELMALKKMPYFIPDGALINLC